MAINLILLLLGVVLVIYGVRIRMKVWTGIGAFLICLALISFGVDYMTGGAVNDANINYRLPFILK